MKKYPVAIIDYGIGGLGLYKLIRGEFPHLPILYFSDSGATPYGKLSKKALHARVERVFEYLKAAGAEKIIVACHSASSVVRDTDHGVTGLRSPTVRAVRKRNPGTVGIIGGGRTIRSGYYRRELNKAGIETRQRVAQQLSILVERGEVDSPAVDKAVSTIMRPLSSCKTILLACTHYPVLSEVILRHSPGGTRLIDPVNELFDSVHGFLRHASRSAKGSTKFLTTGDTALMKKAAWKAFGVSIPKVTRVTF